MTKYSHTSPSPAVSHLSANIEGGEFFVVCNLGYKFQISHPSEVSLLSISIPLCFFVSTGDFSFLLLCEIYIYDIYVYMYNMWERVKNSRTISVVVNNEEYEEFKKTLPRNTTVGEYIRKIMREEIELQKKEEALNSQDLSALSSISKQDKQSTLDKFFPDHITDWKTFKGVIEKLEDSERRKLTEVWLNDFRILEATNGRKGKKVYPFLRL